MSDVQRSFKPNKPRPVGAGLSLEKFAKAGFSKYDKRKKIEKLKKEKIIKYGKYQKIKKKFEASGVLGRTLDVKDAIAELEELNSNKRKRGPDSEDDEKSGERDTPATDRKRIRRHTSKGGGVKDDGLILDDDNGREESEEEVEGGRDTGKFSKLKGKDARGKPQKKKYVSKIERMAAEAQAQKEEKERLREEARLKREERERRMAEMEKQRRQQRQQYHRKTSRGQPIMAVRVNKILDVLQREQKQQQQQQQQPFSRGKK